QTSEASSAGTGVLVEPQLASPTAEQLDEAFDLAARAYGLAGTSFLVEPQVFPTAVSALTRRYVAGDNRAPVIIAGDAAQTGHVFSGQTAFVNLALALSLAHRLATVRTAIANREVTNAHLLAELEGYDAESASGALLLANASTRHYNMHRGG